MIGECQMIETVAPRIARSLCCALHDERCIDQRCGFNNVSLGVGFFLSLKSLGECGLSTVSDVAPPATHWRHF